MGCGNSTSNKSYGKTATQNLDLSGNARQPESGDTPPLTLEELRDRKVFEMIHLKKLIIDKHALESMPENLFNLTELEELSFSDGELTSISPKIGELKNLKKLELYGNKITEIPVELFELAQLEELNLFNNKIKKIPEEINKLTNLVSLNLGENKFMKLPVIENLTKLENLQFHWGVTIKCMGSWENLPLKNLMCNRCRLVALPKLPNTLESLDINKNSLEQLEGLDECKSLTEFQANDNRFTEVPKAIFTSNLKLFKMSNNMIAVLPEEIGQAGNLQSLFISNNKLTSLPESITSLQCLIRCDLTKNELTGPENEATLSTLKSIVTNKEGVKGIFFE